VPLAVRVVLVAGGALDRERRRVLSRSARLEASTAPGRPGTPDDVARACLALATQLTHATGQVLLTAASRRGEPERLRINVHG